jgi:uncharacterized protein (TIGR02145 family)
MQTIKKHVTIICLSKLAFEKKYAILRGLMLFLCALQCSKIDSKNDNGKYSLSITINAGTVERNPDKNRYAEGEVVTLTAKPDSGYTFLYWKEPDCESSGRFRVSGNANAAKSTTTVTMNSHKWITACLTTISYGTMTDIEGNVYHTVKIGNQEWTVENLQTKKYCDGSKVPQIIDANKWGSLKTPGYCFSSDIGKYGFFYNWYAINTGKLAPKGWHIPDQTEWNILVDYLISNRYTYDGTNIGDRFLGNKVAKSLAGKTGWDTTGIFGDIGAIRNDLNCNNKTGFTAIPAGYRNCDNIGLGFEDGFYQVGESSYWWCTTQYQYDVSRIRSTDLYAAKLASSQAWCRSLHSGSSGLIEEHQSKGWGMSVRLLRD